MYELLILLFIGHTINASDNQIFTTVRAGAENVVWDGKWTFLQEWKTTSLNQYGDLIVRTGHDYNNLYILLDYNSPTKLTKYSDSGIVCINANITREQNENDQCFLVTLGSNHPITLKGGSNLASNDYLTKVSSNPDLLAVGGISDSNDRYSNIPHMSYEFRVPIKLIGKTDSYRFFAGVYDSADNKFYSWPNNHASNIWPYVPASENWGELISPDKSLPEFPMPLIGLIISFSILIYLTRKSFHKLQG